MASIQLTSEQISDTDGILIGHWATNIPAPQLGMSRPGVAPPATGSIEFPEPLAASVRQALSEGRSIVAHYEDMTISGRHVASNIEVV